MITHLVGETAIDVSRITGLPWRYVQLDNGGCEGPCLDLLELPWWDRFRVAWTIIGGEYVLGGCEWS